MTQFVKDYAGWFSFWGLVISLLGLILTICQFITVVVKVQNVEAATRLRIKNTLNLVTIVEIINLIAALQDKLLAKDWDKSIDKMSQLHMYVSEIVSDETVKEAVRPNFQYCVSQITSDLSILRGYKQQTPSSQQVNSMHRNLDTLLENLKLVEQKLK